MADVPAPIRRMVDASNAGDTPAFLACFTPDAFLSDWGRDFTGRDGLADWNATDNIGVNSHLEVVAAAPDGAAWQVTVAVSGGFDGEGTMTFTLAGDLISRLVIS